jgi:hypothetical protein
MHKFLKSSLFLFAILFFTMPFASAQEVRVIDNKGTISTVRNNNVYTSSTDPNTTSDKIVENDVWFDTSTTPNSTKIWDSTAWVKIEVGKSLFSVTTTLAIADEGFVPGNTSDWINMDNALPVTIINVKAGDFLDVRVNISEDFPLVGTFSSANDMGDIIRLYVNTAGLIGSPTMIETLIRGGNNTSEVAAASLNQLFTVIADGVLAIGIQVKYSDNSTRIYSTNKSGRGALQVIIYR